MIFCAIVCAIYDLVLICRLETMLESEKRFVSVLLLHQKTILSWIGLLSAWDG